MSVPVSMSFRIFSRLSAASLGLRAPGCRFLTPGSGLLVKHDRQKLRFTVAPGSGAGPDDCAVLHYKFTGEKEVDLTSTFVPETFRGQGVAALLSQAAIDFLIEEKLKAHISCWYIKKYMDANPKQCYKDLIIT